LASESDAKVAGKETLESGAIGMKLSSMAVQTSIQGFRSTGTTDADLKYRVSNTEIGKSNMPTTSNLKRDSNRKNAMKSTGPRTMLGKSRSRLNALRHGLAAMPIDNHVEVVKLAKAISGEGSSPSQEECATTIAECIWMLRRVQEIRSAIIETGSAANSSKQLARLERYERRALSRRKKAIRQFVEAGMPLTPGMAGDYEVISEDEWMGVAEDDLTGVAEHD
jgi:hypothetical protein